MGFSAIWRTRVSVLVLILLQAFLPGRIWTVVLLALLPVGVSLLTGLHVSGEKRFGLAGDLLSGGVLIVLGLTRTVTLPIWVMIPGLLWLAGCGGWLLMGQRVKGKGVPGYWLGVMLMTVLALLVSANLRFEGDIIAGLTQRLLAEINSRQDSSLILYQAYQSGLMQLPRDQAAYLDVADKLTPGLAPYVMSSEMLDQLRMGLRLTVEQNLPTLLPDIMMGVMALLTAACTFTFAKAGADAPAFQSWHVPRGVGRYVLTTFLLGTIGLLLSNRTLRMLGVMLYASAAWIFRLQGMSMMNWMMSQNAASRLRRGVISALGLLLVPGVFGLMGCLDQWRDPRGLRKAVE